MRLSKKGTKDKIKDIIYTDEYKGIYKWIKKGNVSPS